MSGILKTAASVVITISAITMAAFQWQMHVLLQSKWNLYASIACTLLAILLLIETIFQLSSDLNGEESGHGK